MVLSTLALVGIIQLFLLLAGGIFFLFLHTRFLKKQIRELRGENLESDGVTPLAMAAMTEVSVPAGTEATSGFNLAESGEADQEVSGEISELRKMLDEKLLLTANLRKLIEALEQNPDSAPDVAEQQKSSLLHLEEYIKLSRKEGAAVEEKILHYQEQLAKAKKMLSQLKAMQAPTKQATAAPPDQEPPKQAQF